MGLERMAETVVEGMFGDERRKAQRERLDMKRVTDMLALAEREGGRADKRLEFSGASNRRAQDAAARTESLHPGALEIQGQNIAANALRDDVNQQTFESFKPFGGLLKAGFEQKGEEIKERGRRSDRTFGRLEAGEERRTYFESAKKRSREHRDEVAMIDREFKRKGSELNSKLDLIDANEDLRLSEVSRLEKAWDQAREEADRAYRSLEENLTETRGFTPEGFE